MALDPKVFKAYDVRGIYPTEIDEAGAYAVGRGYADVFEPKRSSRTKRSSVTLVGCTVLDSAARYILTTLRSLAAGGTQWYSQVSVSGCPPERRNIRSSDTVS